MAKELSTERGSGGIDMILWSFLLLIFIALPLICGVFELYTYTLYGVKWSAATENVLDQVEWQLETEMLSECDRKLLIETTHQVLVQSCEKLSKGNRGEEWAVEDLAFSDGNPPYLTIDLSVKYSPVTMVGVFICQSEKMKINIHRQREFPVDR